MSVIQFELTEKHVRLLKNLRWSINAKNFIVGTDNEEEDIAPFGENSLYEAIDLILNGKPEEFNPLEVHEPIEYSDAQKAEWDELYKQLPLALELILYNSSFEIGTYRCKFHDHQWKKIK